ncbi:MULTISPECIES: Pls/PosA family non-ribosomal peptide synthetase [Mycobacterium]|uniref:Non-ribosomal peptide synthetase n=3 Tax=Mycobacterium TaxID=1763 RepID=A0ABP8RDH6_9MYCO|nr:MULTISPECIES: Pls/PosA family non-ribosomal peptide synthetase [Mycobacterium avium complex (MAC)]ETA92110.1 amino acid adenylation protein [Mycobacterium avium 10-5581]ASX03476.1 amino acid adenylation protein [Mycobacterium intracellulare subsp. chimaera]PBA61260.1 amino acid adenylation protein [Mycobacterium intracellulare subsp. chimaera]PBJ31366.1 amino acid adenylation protein [Mycobacterium avium subsp. hominissuis]QLK92884.1 amino acid adenylation domain-containing protein [Mycobac
MKAFITQFRSFERPARTVRGQRWGEDRVAVPSSPALNLVSAAPEPRTLVGILYETASRYPDAPALDDGAVVLTYRELIADVEDRVAWLAAGGIGRGDRVGIRMPSGSNALYVAILATLAAGGAYVPVDAEDPAERADLVFTEAGVVAVITEHGLISGPGSSRGRRAGAPLSGDDAWIIFTSGSTGTPKGVAVTHRSAAAFVDAEAQIFLQHNPIGPGDRVLAGLSVAFDASCEEMWLAWRHGACLVPAPRSLVRAGADLGPWLVARAVTVVSTVPTLAALWPPEAFAAVRLLIVGGEACPPELAERLAVAGREVWNTYGPTEATVVACAARLTGRGPVRIGAPLPGWDLAVVDRDGQPVRYGEVGELVIAGVGLGRYLDVKLDAERFAPLPSLGWDRAYRSGDLVRLELDGLVFVGRADDQVKVGGRRIELGEVESALSHLPGINAAAAAVRRTAGGVELLVGYIVSIDPAFDVTAARTALRRTLPAALVPRLVLVNQLPTRTSGKVDRDALPWPVTDMADESPDLGGTMGWLAGLWRQVLGAAVDGPDADFFALGGESLSAAQLVVALRQRYPQVTISQLYDHPRLSSLAGFLDGLDPPVRVAPRAVCPTPRSTQVTQVLLSLPLATLTGMQWVTWLALASNVAAALRPLPWLVTVDWWWIIAGFVLFISPPGRVGIAVLGARLLLSRLRPGTYRRGGSEHLRVWFAERLAEASRVETLLGTPWLACYARALGNTIGTGVDLHAMPPVSGMLTLGDRSAIEPEVDLAGHWVDGDLFHIGRIAIGNDAIVGARTGLLPGASVGDTAQIAPGSSVLGAVGNGQYWAGSPAVMSGRARHRGPRRRPHRAPLWGAVFGLTPALLGALPLLADFTGLAVLAWGVRESRTLLDAIVPAVSWTPVAVAAALTVYAALTVLGVRVLSLGLGEGYHPVRSRAGWQLWATGRLVTTARTHLFPLYAGMLTPGWLRLLGAQVGRGTEISTALLTPKFTVVADGAFLADNVMVASYELGGGWIHVATATIGNRAFLGNSSITQPGRLVPDGGLVAVLSLAPDKATTRSSWLGSPPVRLRRRPAEADAGRTYHPSLRLRLMRAVVETVRLIPLMVSFAIGVGVVDALQWLASEFGYGWAALGSGVVLLAAGAIAGGAAVAAKWLLVGRIRVTERPLWSSFVWRNEVVEVFIETVSAPWFARAASGTPVLNLWLRALGASIGRGVWCETYWLPEADLVTLGVGATVNRGSVVQTHVFHDRIMRTGSVVLESGATLGPHSVALPGARLGAGATVGPSSLVMRGDHVPPSARWQGNPVAPWICHKTRPSRAAGSQTEKIAA